MSDLKLGGLAFDRGIERIIHARQGETALLPEREESAPPDLGARPQLDELLVPPTLDDALDSAIRPQLENRDLLMPARFQQALDGALQGLRQAAEQAVSSTGAGEGSEDQRALNRAVRLLGEETKLRELVQMYRSALYQG